MSYNDVSRVSPQFTRRPTHQNQTNPTPSQAPKDGRVVEEGPGHITSDSLAAESLHGSGSFAEGNAVPDRQPSHSTTANTTSTAGATVLPPTSSNTDRITQSEATGEYRTPAEAPTKSEYTGNYHSVEGMVRPEGKAGDENYNVSGGSRGGASTGSAPIYEGGAMGRTAEQAKVKGTNISEGGFNPEDHPNSSFSADIGGEQDPSRLAEGKFQARDASSAQDSGYPGATAGKSGGTHQGGFENLGSEENA